MGTFGSRSRGPVTGQVYLVEPRRFAIGDRLPQAWSKRGRLSRTYLSVFSHIDG